MAEYTRYAVPYVPPSRSPTPPPASPSESYLTTSLASPPYPLPDGQRKLLIFDLNGTLLLRSPRNYKERKIYLRPYVRALVAYISHPRTRAWLDVMVWSSAQAHNVREMVERVFGGGEGAGNGPILRAVWARDTLGLSQNAFYQKTQTTKDLAKPWALFLPITPSSQIIVVNREENGRYSPSVDVYRSSSPPPSSSPPAPSSSLPTISDREPESQLYPHNAETTLLVDDSPLKARLQPWNHLCVAEYDAPLRTRDRAAAGLQSDPQQTDDATSFNDVESQPQQEENVPMQKDRWRKRRKEDQESAVEVPMTSEPSTEPAFTVPKGTSKRAQRRARKRLKKAAKNTVERSSSPEKEDEAGSTPNKDSSPADTESSSSSVAENFTTNSPPTPAKANGKKRKRSSESQLEEPEDDSTIEPSATLSHNEPYDPTLLAVIGVLDYVRSIGNVAAWMRSGGLSSILPNASKNEPDQPSLSDPNQWFASRRLLVAWAARGRKALAELEIDAIPAVE